MAIELSAALRPEYPQMPDCRGEAHGFWFRVDKVLVRTFLRWTGQHRAIWVVVASFALGAMMLTSLPWLARNDASQKVFGRVAVTGFVLAIPAFVALCLFVRCPKCRTRLIWRAISKDSHPNGLGVLLKATECPFCKFASD